MIGKIAYIALLIGLGFFYVVNLHLRGRNTETLRGCLAIVVLGLFVAAFFMFNWKYGILCIVVTFAFTNLIVPVASGVARRMLGYRTGIHESEEGAAFNRMMSGELSRFDYFKEADQEKQRLRKKLERLAALPDLAQVLEDYGLSIDDYLDHYRHLGLCGLSDLAWDIVSDPDELSTLIEMKQNGKSLVEISSAFRGFT